eukprot:scaffold104937_cov75-Phaeocystis_antarctica.AAC.2
MSAPPTQIAKRRYVAMFLSFSVRAPRAPQPPHRTHVCARCPPTRARRERPGGPAPAARGPGARGAL